MGGIDAYTYIEHSAVFASAQTGNMIVFAVKMFNGGIKQAWVNIPVWIGFAAGCFVAQLLIARYKPTLKNKQFYILTMLVTVLVLSICAVLQNTIGFLLLIFMLGWLSGYELTTFRSVGDNTVNNGIMTGNTKNLMLAVYQWLFQHNLQARDKCLVTSLILLTFVAGAYGSALLCTNVDSVVVLWIATILNAAGLIGVLSTKKIEIDVPVKAEGKRWE